jgi:hypothetical protein
MLDKFDIINKRIHYQTYSSGFYGTKLRIWGTYDSYVESEFSGFVVIRYLGKGGGKYCYYNVRKEDVINKINYILKDGGELDRITINEQAPDQHIVLQGEYWNGAENINYFMYSDLKSQMRDALKRKKLYSIGYRTLVMFEYFMTPSSYADFNVLCELFPDHVIELSIYSICVGDIKGRNVLVWEVRKY